MRYVISAEAAISCYRFGFRSAVTEITGLRSAHRDRSYVTATAVLQSPRLSDYATAPDAAVSGRADAFGRSRPRSTSRRKRRRLNRQPIDCMRRKLRQSLSAVHPTTDIAVSRAQCSDGPILLQKSFCTDDQKFCGLQARLSFKDVRDLIASC